MATRKLIVSLLLMLSLTLTSCVTAEEAVVSDTHFEYSFYNYLTSAPIVYIDNVPYYREWRNNGWHTYIVSFDHRTNIRRYSYPRIYTRPLPPLRPRHHYYNRNHYQHRHGNFNHRQNIRPNGHNHGNKRGGR